jgi:ACS family tartrate transporter-like MFS transporter
MQVSMTDDLGFNAQVYGLGSGLFFVGYSLAMVPAQILLLRVGAPRALGVIVTAWGATAMAFSCLADKTQFYVLRLLLGVFESGAFPAIWCARLGEGAGLGGAAAAAAAAAAQGLAARGGAPAGP